MSIFIIILYISSFSAFRAYEVGVTRKGLPASLFAKASPFVVTTALLSESRIVLFESAGVGIFAVCKIFTTFVDL